MDASIGGKTRALMMVSNRYRRHRERKKKTEFAFKGKVIIATGRHPSIFVHFFCLGVLNAVASLLTFPLLRP